MSLDVTFMENTPFYTKTKSDHLLSLSPTTPHKSYLLSLSPTTPVKSDHLLSLSPTKPLQSDYLSLSLAKCLQSNPSPYILGS